MKFIDGCKNHFTEDNIESLFCESDASIEACNSCQYFKYYSNLGECRCEKIDNLKGSKRS